MTDNSVEGGLAGDANSLYWPATPTSASAPAHSAYTSQTAADDVGLHRCQSRIIVGHLPSVHLRADFAHCVGPQVAPGIAHCGTAHGANPWQYLRDVRVRVGEHSARDVLALSPKGWKQAAKNLDAAQATAATG